MEILAGIVRALVHAKWYVALGMILCAVGVAIASPRVFPNAWRGLTQQGEFDKLKAVAP